MVLTEVNYKVVEKAKKTMVNIVKVLDIHASKKPLREEWPNLPENYDYYWKIPFNDSRTINRNSIEYYGQLVIELGNFGTEKRKVNLVGKIMSFVREKESKNPFFELHGGHDVEDTVNSLRGMGIKNIPFHRECYIEKVKELNFDNFKKQKGLHFILAADLREGGLYKIYEIDDFPFRTIVNGRELKKEFKDNLNLIESERKNKSSVYEFYIGGHRKITKPIDEIKRMMFGRINQQNNEGDIIFGDLNHVSISYK